MRLLQTEITPFINNSLHIEIRDQAYLSSPLHGRPCFHSHPELELIFILEGYGKRIIGNKVSRYESGDMVFIGSNVPHIWLSDSAFYKKDSIMRSKVIVMYINPKIFESMLAFVTEFDGMKEMLQQAVKGINIFGETRNSISEKLIALSSKTGFEKAIGFLQIMHLISISEERNFIHNSELDAPTGLNSDRLIDVIKFIKENIQQPISLKKVAEVACMTLPSFCRFFKNRTKMRFSQYLADARMTHACKLLIELDKPISEIAYMCGYNSNSHFCKVFKDHTHQSPYQYKCSINEKAN
ncbi:MAG: AraC family transcriptional regulator [Daejeonella sp.]